jgi:hypothetical protein
MLEINKYYVLSCGLASGLYPWNSASVQLQWWALADRAAGGLLEEE